MIMIMIIATKASGPSGDAVGETGRRGHLRKAGSTPVIGLLVPSLSV